MTTTPMTPLDATLERVLHLLVTARAVTPDGASLDHDLHEVELTIHEVLEVAGDHTPMHDFTTAHAALTAAEAALDALAPRQRPLWLLPLRAELAILRRRSAA